MRPRGVPTGGPTTAVRLAADFYDLNDVIALLDQCVDNEQTVELLTDSYEPFHLDPESAGAIGVVEE